MLSLSIWRILLLSRFNEIVNSIFSLNQPFLEMQGIFAECEENNLTILGLGCEMTHGCRRITPASFRRMKSLGYYPPPQIHTWDHRFPTPSPSTPSTPYHTETNSNQFQTIHQWRGTVKVKNITERSNLIQAVGWSKASDSKQAKSKNAGAGTSDGTRACKIFFNDPILV